MSRYILVYNLVTNIELDTFIILTGDSFNKFTKQIIYKMYL